MKLLLTLTPQTVYIPPKMISNIDLAVCFADYNEDDVDGETRHWSNKCFVNEHKGMYCLTKEQLDTLLHHVIDVTWDKASQHDNFDAQQFINDIL